MISSFFLFNSSISARVMSRLSMEEISKSSFLAKMVVVFGAKVVAMPFCGETKASTAVRATTHTAKRDSAGREIMMKVADRVVFGTGFRTSNTILWFLLTVDGENPDVVETLKIRIRQTR